MKRWIVRQGTSTLTTAAETIEQARERAAGLGFTNPQSIVLEDAIATKPTPEQAGQLARFAYRASCEKFGREVDPISADNEYWRAYRAAEGRTFYAGD